VRLVLYDALGRVAARLVEAGWKTPGAHSVRVATGRLQPGVYLYRLETPDGVVARRMMVR